MPCLVYYGLQLIVNRHLPFLFFSLSRCFNIYLAFSFVTLMKELKLVFVMVEEDVFSRMNGLVESLELEMVCNIQIIYYILKTNHHYHIKVDEIFVNSLLLSFMCM
ncbi:hypothetical protein AMTRI_Chr01g126560 [Amborella trichopoda]